MEPKDFARVILRRKRTVAAAVVIVVASVFFASMRKEPTYVAECKVLFQAVEYDFTNPNAEPFETVGMPEDNIGVLTSPAIATPVAEKLKLPLGDVLNKVNVELEGSTIFRLRVVDLGLPHPMASLKPGEPGYNPKRPDGPRPHWTTNPATRSQDLCNAIGEEYIAFKRNEAATAYAHVLKGKEASLEAVLEQYRVIQRELDTADDKAEAFQFEIRRDTLLNRISDLQGEITGLREQLDDGIDGGGKLITPAGPGVLVGADHKRDLIMGLIIGLIFGMAIAIIREYLDDTVKDKETTQRELGLPVLAALPAVDDIDGLDEPNPGTIEAARNLRATLASLGFPHEKNMLVVTSTLAKRRATTLASLAGAVAESGRSVLVIGSDMRSARTHEAFGIHNSVGLANVVRGQVPFEKAIRPAPGLEGVYVMPAGPIIGNPGELLSSEAMAITLNRARRWADVVLLDAPPVLQAADSSILGAYADGVLLVVSAGQTNRAQATEAKEQLIAAGARVLGAVLVGADENLRKEIHDDLDLGGFGDWGGYGGYEAGGYDAAALDGYDAADLEDPWFDEATVSINAYAEARPARPRRTQPAKKTAASAPGQRPKPKAQPSMPRNGVRTTRGRSGSSAGSGTRKATAKRKPAAPRTTASKGKATAKTARPARKTARKPAPRGTAKSSTRRTTTKSTRSGGARTAAPRTAARRRTTR